MNGVLVCKTCLITNVKMFPLHNLANAYSNLTGLQCDDSTVEFVCYQCAALLLKFQQFRTKCLKANAVILEFVGKYCEITENVLNAIDRKSHNLESTIIKYEIKENIFTELYDDAKFNKHGNEGSKQFIKIEIDDVIIANEIKKEVELIKDDKVQDASDEIGSIYLEDDISLEDNCSLKDDVRNTTDNEKNEINQNSENRSIKKLEHCVDERTNSNKLQNKSRKNIRPNYNSLIDGFAIIENLTPEEALKEVLLRKESVNYKTNPFKCDLCYRGFGTPQTYENHIKKHNKDNGEYNCDCCHIRFTKKRSLTRHIQSNHIMKIICKHCPYVCFNSNQATAHMNLHKGKKYPCQECDQVFKMPNSLQTHQRLKHMSVYPEFACAMCGNIFGKERGLERHINLLHKQDSNEQEGPLCEECDVHFATLSAWKRHLVLSSKHTVSNGCEICGETYESEHALKIHSLVHPQSVKLNTKSNPKDKKSPIHCNLCEKTLIGNVKYDDHMKQHHAKVTTRSKVQCEVCGKMCETHAFYIAHLMTHQSERPYSCSQCDKSYKTPNVLKMHVIATHSSEPAFKCQLCSKTFVFQNSLDRHLKVHRGIRPYKCNVCDKTFPTPGQVKIHTRHIHQKVPWPKRDRSKRKKNYREPSPSSSSSE